MLKRILLWLGALGISAGAIVFLVLPSISTPSEIVDKEPEQESVKKNPLVEIFTKKEEPPALPILDTAEYDRRMIVLANNPPQPKPYVKKVKGKDGKITEQTIVPPPRQDPWPVNTVYPKPGAILPFKRVVAYYGNLYSTKMGVLGQYEKEEMLRRLDVEVKKWENADPETPVVPALHYIAVVAQGSKGADGKYRARMPDSEIQKVLKIAEDAKAIVFLDVQVGLSDLETEVPLLEPYLKLPNVHLGIDPEFAMQTSGKRPGVVVGTLDAKNINFTAEFLAKVVKENNLPPKILVVHRYTEKMVTNYKSIKPLEEVQIVMHMDGWGGQDHKISTYDSFVRKQPVQFTGFKLFYKNDVLEKGTVLFTPEQLLKLNPRPIYIQYQ